MLSVLAISHPLTTEHGDLERGEKVKLIVKGSAKEIADFAFLLQSQRKMKRKAYSNEPELVPIIQNASSHKRGKKTRHA